MNDGVWQLLHPTMAKTFLPFAIDATPPGLSRDGVGGARKRMKNENFSMELIASIGVGRIRVSDAVRIAHVLAIFFTLGLEQIVRDAHLDVVGLAREHQQRLVLRLPPEARDGAIVAVVVALAADGAASEEEVGAPTDTE